MKNSFLVSASHGDGCLVLANFSQFIGLCNRFSVTTHWFVLTTNTKSQDYGMVKTWATSAQGVSKSSYFPFQKSGFQWLTDKAYTSLHSSYSFSRYCLLLLLLFYHSLHSLPTFFLWSLLWFRLVSSILSQKSSLLFCKFSTTIPTHIFLSFLDLLQHSQPIAYGLTLHQSGYFICTSLNSSIYLQAP